MNILICDVKYPFVRGGAELLLAGLSAELQRRGHRTDMISIPFFWDPKEALLRSAAIWRMIDLSLYRYQPIDLVIATKFPSYLIRAPKKITWLFHQYREVYDLWGRPGGQFDPESPGDEKIREEIMRLDETALRESVAVATISKTVSARLKKFNQIDSRPIYTPPALFDRLQFESVGNYLFTVSRLEVNKRIDLLLRAYAASSRAKPLWIGGSGPQQKPLADLAVSLGIAEQVKFLGYLPDEEVIRHYANCLAVPFVPNDEDYGYVTLEALKSGKPVITTTDAGGVLEFVDPGKTGFVAAPTPDALGESLSEVMALPTKRFLAMADACRETVADISWKQAVDQLLAEVV